MVSRGGVGPTGWIVAIAGEEPGGDDPSREEDRKGARSARDRRSEILLPFASLDDLSKQSDADLRARSKMTPGGRVAVLSLKHGRSRVVVRIQVLGPDANAPGARDVLASVLRYILETSQTQPVILRGLLARQVGRKAAEEIMTTAEMLRREGEARGEARGRLQGAVEGKRELLLLQLRQRFGRLPATTVARIDKASAADLDMWASRVLAADSLDEVLGAKARRRA
jgi:hypothetical protein